MKLEYESGAPIAADLTPAWAVTDGPDNPIALFEFREHADLFVEHAGYHPARLSVRPLVGTKYTDPELGH